MTLKISILGLGKIGISIGLALGRHTGKFNRTGYDPGLLPARTPSLKEALDAFEKNPANCVKDADVIFLCLPVEILKSTLQDISTQVRSNAVLLSTSHAKSATSEWVHEIFSGRNQYVGIEFLLAPYPVFREEDEDELGSSDLFENILAAIATPAGTDSAAINLAGDIIRMLGASPYYCDLLEMDGMISTTQILPQLVSSALLNSTIKAPGWQDTGKFAGLEYSATSSSITPLTDSGALSQASVLLKEHVTRGLDSTIRSLVELKTAISDSNVQHLQNLLEDALVGRQIWWESRSNPEKARRELSPIKMPAKGDYWRQQTGFLGRLSRKSPPGNDKKT